LEATVINMNRGFTLIEILVATTVFSLALGAMSSLFVMSLQGQRSIFAQQNLVDNTRFALEQMSRQIRMARRDETGICTGSAGSTYSGGGASIIFIDPQSNCRTYDLSGGIIRMRLDTGQEFRNLTSNDINIERLDFDVRGQEATDGEQPRVTIVIDAKDPNQHSAGIILQTTISARSVDVP